MRNKFCRTIKIVITVAALFLLALSCGILNPGDESGYTLKTSEDNGSITKIPDKARYQKGDTVTLTAVADSGYNFFRWSGDASGTNATTMVIMNGDKRVSANFYPEAIVDIDGNVYHIVYIGDQFWTVENLRTTKYNDGTAITLVTDSAEWANHSTPAYCYYNNMTDADSIKKFGALYNAHAVDTKKLAPAGWRVPTDVDWNVLVNYLVLNGHNWDGTTDTAVSNKIGLSLAARTDWYYSQAPGSVGNNLSGNNRSGFSGLPGGFRLSDGSFNHIGYSGRWWEDASWSDALCLYYFDDGLDRGAFDENCGYSVRLVKE